MVLKKSGEIFMDIKKEMMGVSRVNLRYGQVEKKNMDWVPNKK